MKLIDILVQELPKRGGWPDGKGVASNGPENTVIFHELGKPPFWFAGLTFTGKDTATKEEYEAALAASKQGWNGEFPIPAGTEVEVHFDGDDSRVWTHFRVEYMSGEVVVLHDYRVDSVDAYKHRTLSFRPIRSEEDKKRDEVGLALYHAINWNAEGDPVSPSRMEDYKKAYDAIAAGKIPHIRIE